MVSIVSLLVAFATSGCYGASSKLSAVILQETQNGCGKADTPIILDRTSLNDLPLFPLRKSVRVPSDSLTLNLYEERYIAMSQFILQQDSWVFGTIYASSKPQLVKGGIGEIVPLLEEGDVGVICIVKEWSDDMVPTRDPEYKRRRIKLNAVAVARFQIEEIVDDGIMIPTRPSFIRARVSLLKDSASSYDAGSTNSDILEREVNDRIIAKERFKGGMGSINSLVDQVVSQAAIGGLSAKERRNEIFSFAAAKALGPEVPFPQFMQQLLQTTNTEERLKQILEWR